MVNNSLLFVRCKNEQENNSKGILAQVVPEPFAQFVQQLFVVRSGGIKFRLGNFTLQKSFSCRPGIFLRNGSSCPAIADWVSIYPIYPKCTCIRFHNTQKKCKGASFECSLTEKTRLTNKDYSVTSVSLFSPSAALAISASALSFNPCRIPKE